MLSTVASDAFGADPTITAVSRDVTATYAWNFSSGVKQQHGSYQNGVSLHAVLQRNGSSGENGYPDYLVWFNEHTGQSLALERAVAYPKLGKNPATHAVFNSEVTGGIPGQFWWVMGGRADSQPFDLYRSTQPFNPLVLEQVLDNFVVEPQSTTPALAVVGETGLLAYRWRASGSTSGEVRFRQYGLPSSGVPSFRWEKSIGRATKATELGNITIEQLWSRWDPRYRAFALTWQWFQHDAPTPTGNAFGSNPFLYTDDLGLSWKSADGVPVALPLNYLSATASPVITPYPHLRSGENSNWQPRDIGFTPGGLPWLTLATGPIPAKDDGWTMTLFRWTESAWQSVALSQDMEGDADAMACGPVRDFLVCAYSELATPGTLLVKVSRDDGRSWSAPVAVDNVGPASDGALQRINWVSYAQPADRYLDNTARFFVGYYRVGEADGRDYKNRLRWVRVQVGPKADFNGDGRVDDADATAFSAAYAASDARADFDDDGTLDAADVASFEQSLAGHDAELPPEPPPPIPPTPPGPAFQQPADGLVSMEAESLGGLPAGWSGMPSPAASNGAVIKATAGATTPNTDRALFAEYRVNFTRTGTHNVWTRMRGFPGTQYRLRVGLDAGAPSARATTSDAIWRWKKLATPLSVTSPGVHVIRIYRKDANVELDKIVLTPAGTAPTGLGPPESPRS